MASSGIKASQASLSLDKLFVITLEFQNPKFDFPASHGATELSLLKNEVKALSEHSLMLEV